MATRRRAAAKTNRCGSKKRKRSKWEDSVAALIEVNGWPKPEREVIFHEKGVVFKRRRMYRADFIWPDLKLIVEADGGIFNPISGHRTPKGLTDDRTRDWLAQMQGYFIVRLTELHFRDGLAELMLGSAIEYCQRRAIVA